MQKHDQGKHWDCLKTISWQSTGWSFSKCILSHATFNSKLKPTHTPSQSASLLKILDAFHLLVQGLKALESNAKCNGEYYRWRTEAEPVCQEAIIRGNLEDKLEYQVSCAE